MPSTALTICNAALIKLGAKTMASITDDSRKEGELCIERYPKLRDTLLRNHTWAFAKRIMTITCDADTDTNWGYSFGLPADLGRILSVFDEADEPIPYERAGTVIYTDHETVNFRYIKKFDDVDDTEEFPDDFAEVISCMLAAELCLSLTQTQALRDTYLNEYTVALAQARFNGATERADQVIGADTWVDARINYAFDDRGSRNLAAE